MSTAPAPPRFRGLGRLDTACDEIKTHLSSIISTIKKDETNNNVVTIDKDAYEKLVRCHEVAVKQEEYMNSILPGESPLLKKLTDATITNEDPEIEKWQIMLSGHFVGQLLQQVAGMLKAKKILEIGVFTGYGSVTLAETPDCEVVLALDQNEKYLNFVETFIKGTHVENKIRTVLGPALDSLKKLSEEPNMVFDMVFIDADKPSYHLYFKYLLDNKMVRKGGIIACDNILWYNDACMDEPTSIPGQKTKEFVKMVNEDERVSQLLIPIRDGVMLVRVL